MSAPTTYTKSCKSTMLVVHGLEGTSSLIIESVDSICRDTTDTQLKLIQKNLPKSLQISKTGGK